MAKFWFISAPLYSHTDWGGFLGTAQSIAVTEHDVIWISEERLRGAIEAADLPFMAVEKTGWLWPPPPQPDFSSIPPQEAVNLRYKRALDTWLTESLVREATQGLIDLANEIGKPDVIVSDPFLTASALAAEALNVPLAICGWPAQSTLDEAQLFPVQRDLSTDSSQRIARLLKHFSLNGTNFSKGTAPAIQSPHLHICYFTHEWYIAEDLTLQPQNIFVGGNVQPPQSPPPDWLDKLPADAPLGLVTLGTTFTGDLGFFSWSAQAAARAGLIPIVVIGWNPISQEDKQELINALPKGSFLLNWIPFEHVLPRSKLIIHHGGMGTTHKALIHGVPQIVVPHAADQRIQAKRVAQAKVGLNLSAHDVRQGLLWEGAQALLSDDKVRRTAKQVAEEMAACGGVERARDALLKLL